MDIIDTHCHLDVTDFYIGRDDVIARCRAQGTSKLIIPAIESQTWHNVLIPQDFTVKSIELGPKAGSYHYSVFANIAVSSSNLQKKH